MDRILWLDLETTGLDVDRCQVLEVGCVLSKGFSDGLEVVGEFALPVRPRYPMLGMPAVVEEMHRASGLWDEAVSYDAPTVGKVEGAWLRWLANHDLMTDGGLVVGGSGVDRFDMPIIERVFPNIARLFHWRRMDVSAMKLLLNETGHGDLTPKQTGQQHRALADAHWARTVALTMSAVLEFGPWRQRFFLGAEQARTEFSESEARLRETFMSQTDVEAWAASVHRRLQADET